MVNNLLVVNAEFGETRAALIEDGMIAEFHMERSKGRTCVGNIYLGKVGRVLPGMQAAFIELGLERASYLPVGDALDPGDFEQRFLKTSDEEMDLPSKAPRVSRDTPIRELLHPGQAILVQVSKDPIGTKGARVTSHVSLPGRYVVYMPMSDSIGISKRIESEQERERLRRAVEDVRPTFGGWIVRTVAQEISDTELQDDVRALSATWNRIVDARKKRPKAPCLLHEEPELIMRLARDKLDNEVSKVVIDDKVHHARVQDFVREFVPARVNDIELYAGTEPIFDAYGIEDEIRRALSRRVPLASGGYLVIDQAEALTAIDVNTGRFVGKGSKTLEDTVLQTNLEAVAEIAYQLRFRNLGGLIVLDLIDMDKQSHKEQVRHRLEELLKKDKAATSIHAISELGLIEMTRKRTSESLGRILHEPCFYCDGTGHLQSRMTIAMEILRQVRREIDYIQGPVVRVHAHPGVVEAIRVDAPEALQEAQVRYQRKIELVARSEYHIEQFDLQGS